MAFRNFLLLIEGASPQAQAEKNAGNAENVVLCEFPMFFIPSNTH